MKSLFNCYISGVGHYLPPTKITNFDLYKRVKNFNIAKARNSLMKKEIIVEGKSNEEIFNEWVKQVTGIEERYYANDKDYADNPLHLVEFMASKASKQAIASAGLKPTDIDHVIFATFSSRQLIPSPACLLGKFIDFGEYSGIVINGACSGFLDGLITAFLQTSSGLSKHVLVVGSECLTDFINFDDPTTSIIFGDGAGAAVISQSSDKNDNRVFGVASDISYSTQINIQYGGVIEMGGGPLVQRNAVNSMVNVLYKAISQTNLSLKDLTYILPHQANLRILNVLEGKMQAEQPHLKVIKNIQHTGNTSSATVPIALYEYVNNQLADTPYQKNNYIGFTSVGGGYTFSSSIVQI